MSTKCPHRDVQFCPLYRASHVPVGLGCDDGKGDSGECAVSRGVSYIDRVRQIRAKLPGLVEEAEWAVSAAAAMEQRRRNLKLNGIH